MNNFEFMKDLIPSYLQKETNLELVKSIAETLDYVESYIDIIDNMWIISDAYGNWLDILGILLKTSRGNLDDDLYRKKLKVILASYYLVPTIDNFIGLIQNAMGYSVENIKEGWKHTGESGLLQLDVVVPIGHVRDLLSDLQHLYTAGCRLEYNKLQESYDAYAETSLVECGSAPIYTLIKRVPIPFIDIFNGYNVTGNTETGVDGIMDTTILGGI